MALVQIATARVASGATIPVTLSSPPTAGHPIIVGIFAKSVLASSLSVADSASNSYTQAQLTNQGSVLAAIFYSLSVAPGVGSFTVTVTNAHADVCEVVVAEYNDALTGIDLMAGNSGMLTPSVSGTIAQTGDRLIVVTGSLGAGTLTAPSGTTAQYTETDSTTYIVGQFADESSPTTGDYVWSWGGGVSGAFAAVAVAFTSSGTAGSLAPGAQATRPGMMAAGTPPPLPKQPELSLPQGLILFPGITQPIGGEYTLVHGISPGVFTIEMLPQPGVYSEIGDVVISFGLTTLIFPDCKVDRNSFRFGPDGFIWSVSIMDRRWRWGFGQITGDYNTRQDDGKVNTNLPLATPQHLAALCLEAMGETGYDVTQLPNNTLPQIHWEADNPARALDELVNSLGCRVVLGLDNAVTIWPTGAGADLPGPTQLPFQAGSESFKSVVPPDSFLVVTNKVRYQMDFLLAPVGIDLDGSVKLLPDLSYAPPAGWSTVDPDWFLEIGDPLARELAKKSVWRWYQIQPFNADGSEPFAVPGYPGPPIQALWQVLPLEEFQVQFTTEADGSISSLPAQVAGQFWDGEFTFSNTAPNTPYRKSFSIQKDTGIVQFDEQVYGLDNFGNPTFAVLHLRTAFSVRDFTTGAYYRATRSYSTGIDTGTGPRVLKHDETQGLVYPIYGGPNGETILSIVDNNAAVVAECDFWIQAALLEYAGTDQQEATYAGLWPIDLDGAIQQVTWHVGEPYAFTKACKNNEYSITVPNYQERRALEGLRGNRLGELAKTVREMKRQIADNPEKFEL